MKKVTKKPVQSTVKSELSKDQIFNLILELADHEIKLDLDTFGTEFFRITCGNIFQSIQAFLNIF